MTIALNTEITAALRNEGFARELVNRIQNIRKSTNLNVSDRIHVSCVCPAELQSAFDAHREYIASETLCASLDWSAPHDSVVPETIEIDGITSQIWIRRAVT